MTNSPFSPGALCFAGVTALANGEAMETLYSTSSLRWRATPMDGDIELEDGFGGRAAHQSDLAAQLPYLERDAAAAKSALVSHGLA